MRISDWSSDVCSSDLLCATADAAAPSGSAPSGSIYNAPPRQGFGIKLGFNSGYKKAMLAYETRPLWDYPLASGGGKLSLSLELGVSYWKARYDDPDSMWQKIGRAHV